MSEYQEIQSQIAELQRRAESIRATERTAALANIKALMMTFDISASELSRVPVGKELPRKVKVHSRVQKVAPKYRDGSGNEWTGRGLQPRWLKAAVANGKTLESLLIL